MDASKSTNDCYIQKTKRTRAIRQSTSQYRAVATGWTHAFFDSVSTVSFIDQSVQENLRAQSTDVALNITGIHRTKDLKTERVPLKKREYFQKCIQPKHLHNRQSPWETETTTTTSWSKASITWVMYPTKASTWQLDGSWHHPWSRCLWDTTPIGVQDRNTKWTFRRSNRARMGVSRPTTSKIRKNVCHFAFREDVKVAEDIQIWWDIET